MDYRVHLKVYTEKSIALGDVQNTHTHTHTVLTVSNVELFAATKPVCLCLTTADCFSILYLSWENMPGNSE